MATAYPQSYHDAQTAFAQSKKLNLLWTIIITSLSVISGTSICFWLLSQARDVATTAWILQSIICPVIRIIVLLIIVSQIYPSIDENFSSIDFWQVLSQQGQFNDLINILFFGSLALAFVPIISHPVFALPLQSCLTIALVFQWQYLQQLDALSLFPSLGTILKIIGYMIFAYFITREFGINISRRLDQKLVITGSTRLVTDAIYLVLQIPVMLLYCGFLKAQLE